MMPDLGRYAGEVMLAYGVSFGLMAGLIAWVWLRARASKRALEELETRMRKSKNG